VVEVEEKGKKRRGAKRAKTSGTDVKQRREKRPGGVGTKT
jgi:hypothetical protein